MDPSAAMDLDIPASAMPSVQLALKHFDSDDVFQQLLSLDSALQSLRAASATLEPQSEVLDGHGAEDDPEDVQQPLRDVEALIQIFEELQAVARHRFNVRVRPLLRNLNILHLPDELLLRIFDHFNSWMDRSEEASLFLGCSDLEGNVKTIQNARLTCRRFCDTSSHLLVPCLYMTPSLSSLKRLEQVALHPTISQGERLFVINAGFYSAAIANDFPRFARMCYEKVREKSRLFEAALESSDESLRFFRGTDSAARAEIETSRRILSSWGPLRFGDQADEDTQVDAAVLALRRGHERYRELFEQQEHLLRDGLFARILALAAARSHSKVWLAMSDSSGVRYKSESLVWNPCVADPDLVADPDRLVQDGLLRTQEWYEARGDEAHEAPQSLLYQLPLEMRAAGARLLGFSSMTSAPYDLNLELSNDQLAGLREVAKGLEVFRFGFYEEPDEDSAPVRTPRQITGLFSYLSAAMGHQSVSKVYLYLVSINTFNSDIVAKLGSIGPLLTSPALPRLKSLQLHGIAIHMHQLSNLMGMVKSGIYLEFFQIHLISGTWAEALDCLRSKAGRNSCLMFPSGAECENMTHDNYDDIFQADADPSGPDSKATQYITSVEGVRNPLRGDVEASEANIEL